MHPQQLSRWLVFKSVGSVKDGPILSIPIAVAEIYYKTLALMSCSLFGQITAIISRGQIHKFDIKLKNCSEVKRSIDYRMTPRISSEQKCGKYFEIKPNPTAKAIIKNNVSWRDD